MTDRNEAAERLRKDAEGIDPRTMLLVSAGDLLALLDAPAAEYTRGVIAGVEDRLARDDYIRRITLDDIERRIPRQHQSFIFRDTLAEMREETE